MGEKGVLRNTLVLVQDVIFGSKMYSLHNSQIASTATKDLWTNPAEPAMDICNLSVA